MSVDSHVPPPRPPHKRLTEPGQIDHHIADLTATVSADVTLGVYQARLAESGQWFPIDGNPDAPLGSLIERNSTGPLRLGYGAWRDLLLGAQLENGKGELITAGGRTVKNVAGYDLTKFSIGQAGIFAKVVTLTTRTYRRPDAALLARFDGDPRLINRLIPSDCRPQWAIMTADALFCGFVSDTMTIEFYEREIQSYRPRDLTRRSLDDDIALRRSMWRADGEIHFRAAVPPQRVKAFLEAISIADAVADPAFGIIIGGCPEAQMPRLRKLAAEADGAVVFRREDGSIVNVTSDAVEHTILRRLKQAFDPEGRLAPLPALSAAQSSSSS